MTHTERVQEMVREYPATPDSFPLVKGDRIEFWQTKTQGTDVVIVSPDRRIRYAGTLFINEEENQ